MSHSSGTNDNSGIKQVVDFTEARAVKMDEKRRKTERIFFKHLLGVYCVTGNTQMRPIELVEVSEDGCSFQIPFDGKTPWPAEHTEIPIRLYFSQDTYIPVHIKVQNSRDCIDEGSRYTRFGCAVDETFASYPAYQQFVRFLKSYSEHAHKDKGDVSIFYL
ncbi:MAG: hypothetical protein H7222_10565 [Methylotenera sp.]|nr:hypothetical protein [Oligoflexia bacterium]